MVYQYSALLSSLLFAENVALPLEELTDKSRNELDKIVDEKLDLVGMKDARPSAGRTQRRHAQTRGPRARACARA